ncbi:MAG: hypothetical protein J5642_00355 [Bacteroidales bacterium]|nr:hypothetical protein [Bacteroidales bacterium]
MRHNLFFLFILLFFSVLTSNGTPVDPPYGSQFPNSEERKPREPKSHDGNFGKRVTLGVTFGIGPDWLNPRTDSLHRNGTVLALKYGIAIDVNFTTKENYYFTTGVFFNHSGGHLAFEGFGFGADSLVRDIERRYSSIYVTIPTGIKLKTNSMKGWVVAANFGLYHSIRLTAKASDKYYFGNERRKTEKYMYRDQTALFREAGYIGVGTEYVVSGSFRVFFYALYAHTFTNFFNPKKSMNMASGGKDKANIGGVEFQIGLCF